MTKSKTFKYLYIMIAIIGIIISIVFFYQYNCCKENAKYAVESAASYYQTYGIGSDNGSFYNSYESLQIKAKGYLTGGIISVIITILSIIVFKIRHKRID